MKAILIDDDLPSLTLLQAGISRYAPHVEVVASCTTASDAIAQIKHHRPDVVFLDIEMTEGTGFDILKHTAPRDYAVIVISGSDKYALAAIRVGAIDYLVKPVQVNELVEAISKVTQRKHPDNLQQLEMLMNYFKPARPKVRRIALTASDHLIFVDTNDIIYCESDSNYTTFFLADGQKVVISKTLKDVGELLNDDDFFRIHASYLINMKHVSKFTRGDGGYVVMSNKQQIAVSRKKKDEFFEKFSACKPP